MLGLASEWRLKRDTESLIVEAQNQSIRTNLVSAIIDKSQENSLRRMCRKVDESIDDSVSGCNKLAQKEYKRRHDNLGKKYIGSLLEKVKVEINGINMSQKVFQRMKLIKSCGISVFRLIMLWKLGN